MFGFENHKSPDDHFQDIKRVLSAIGGKAKRITVVMPMLYASRQHRRKGRESLDCSLALQELERLGVNDIITFDVHDPNVQNAIPLISFDNLYPTYEIVKTRLKEEPDLTIDKSSMLVISPDTGAMDRAIYYSSVLGLDIGLFYKRRDHSTIVNGKNPIVQHEYIGRDVEGQDILIVDDMIASGESVFDIVLELKKLKAKRIFVTTTFALFTEGVQKFNKFYEEGLIEKIYSTNLTYIPQEAREAKWFKEVDMSEFIANVIHNLNYDRSIAPLVDATSGIKKLLSERK
jgi:ribose-phosphate pyrophosphokinase